MKKTFLIFVLALFWASSAFAQTQFLKVANTTTALKQMPVTDVHIGVIVLGYSVRGDGGGGIYYFDSTSTDTPDDTDVVLSDRSSTGRWIRVLDYSGGGGGTGVTDGDKGDVTVTGDGTTWTVDQLASILTSLASKDSLQINGDDATDLNLIAGDDIDLELDSSTTPDEGFLFIRPNAVDYDQIQQVSAVSRLLGRGSSSGVGNVEEIQLGEGLEMDGTTINVTGKQAAFTTGAGATNVGNVLSWNAEAGTNIVFLTNANGRVSINTPGGGGGGFDGLTLDYTELTASPAGSLVLSWNTNVNIATLTEDVTVTFTDEPSAGSSPAIELLAYGDFNVGADVEWQGSTNRIAASTFNRYKFERIGGTNYGTVMTGMILAAQIEEWVAAFEAVYNAIDAVNPSASFAEITGVADIEQLPYAADGESSATKVVRADDSRLLSGIRFDAFGVTSNTTPLVIWTSDSELGTNQTMKLHADVSFGGTTNKGVLEIAGMVYRELDAAAAVGTGDTNKLRIIKSGTDTDIVAYFGASGNSATLNVAGLDEEVINWGALARAQIITNGLQPEDDAIVYLFSEATSLASSVLGAYSITRKLEATYSGPAITCFFTASGTTNNIGFLSNGKLDTNTLVSLAGAGDAEIMRIYDQKSVAGRHIVKGSSSIATDATRPKIVIAGTLQVDSGDRPRIKFDANDSASFSTISDTPDFTYFLTFANDGFVSGSIIVRGGSTTRGTVRQLTSSNRLRLASGANYDSTTTLTTGVKYLARATFKNGGNESLAINGAAENTPGSGGANQLTGIGLGESTSGAAFYFQELIVYSAEISDTFNDAEQTLIENNIKTFYGL